MKLPMAVERLQAISTQKAEKSSIASLDLVASSKAWLARNRGSVMPDGSYVTKGGV